MLISYFEDNLLLWGFVRGGQFMLWSVVDYRRARRARACHVLSRQGVSQAIALIIIKT